MRMDEAQRAAARGERPDATGDADVVPLFRADRVMAGEACEEMSGLVRRQLALLGEDPERDGLRKTPERVARSLAWLTRGYAMDVREVITTARTPGKRTVLVRVKKGENMRFVALPLGRG